jgi:hypothetical protein
MICRDCVPQLNLDFFKAFKAADGLQFEVGGTQTDKFWECVSQHILGTIQTLKVILPNYWHFEKKQQSNLDMSQIGTFTIL